MSLKQDRTGTRTSEDLRRRLNVGDIADAADKVDASVEQVQKLSNQVSGLNNAVTDTRKNYVSTVNQSFTTEQKKIARQNIGAGTSSFSGSYNDLDDRPKKVSAFVNDVGYMTYYKETDPTVPTYVKNITESDIAKWNSGTGGGGGVTGNVLNNKSSSTTDTYSCNYINKINSCSTTEQEIGTWHDGKPLYRKLISVTPTLNTQVGISLSELNVKNIINLYGMTYETNVEVPINFNNGTDSNSCYYNVSEKKLWYKFTWGTLAHIYIEYTKTTD